MCVKSCFCWHILLPLHLPNIVPISAKSFDVTRNLLRSDVIFGTPGAHIIIKWSKAMQSSTAHQVVQVPLNHPSLLCPVHALKSLLAFVPASSSSPSSSSPLLVSPSSPHPWFPPPFLKSFAPWVSALPTMASMHSGVLLYHELLTIMFLCKI